MSSLKLSGNDRAVFQVTQSISLRASGGASPIRSCASIDPPSNDLFIGRSEEAPAALVAVVLWPNGVDHGVLGGFLIPQLKELGLERPNVERPSVDDVGFDAITAVRA